MEKINPYNIKIGDKIYSIKEDNSEFGYSIVVKTITEIKLTNDMLMTIWWD